MRTWRKVVLVAALFGALSVGIVDARNCKLREKSVGFRDGDALEIWAEKSLKGDKDGAYTFLRDQLDRDHAIIMPAGAQCEQLGGGNDYGFQVRFRSGQTVWVLYKGLDCSQSD